MRFTWDEGKRDSNLAKHGMDLLQARFAEENERWGEKNVL
jgi:uncharacterized DUF497 family protein